MESVGDPGDEFPLMPGPGQLVGAGLARSVRAGNRGEKLAQKVKTGGSGAWGAIPMPPNNVPDADLNALVAWAILSRAAREGFQARFIKGQR